mmetsp:Transcript_41666/g.40044  ORF Transcript_41666/g.40044 Transcript_41666/m.40044 type:complete len:83 (+) Transcript_41666:398-646(+)
MQVVPIKRWISNVRCLHFLLDDSKRLVKGIWSIIFSIPVIVFVMFEKNPQLIITYTGSLCGTFILFLFPVALVYYVRKAKID